MPLLRPLDPVFPIERQLAVDATPVVLVNVFTLDKADEQTFLQAWQSDAAFMKQSRASSRRSFTARSARARPI